MSSEKGRTFKHLKWNDRLRIEKMLKEKKSKSEIARTLRVDYTTIMREIKRSLTVQRDTNLIEREVCCAETAERKYQENLRAKGSDIKLGNDHELARYIEDKIADDGYSPETALHKIKEDNLAFSVTLSKWTVYKYINDGVFLRLTNKALPMGGKKKQESKKVQTARAPKGTGFTELTEADTLEVQRWVNEYPRGTLGGKCAGRVLLELAKEAEIEGAELLLLIMHKKVF